MKQLQKRILFFLTVFFALFALSFYLFTTSLVKEHSFEQQENSVQIELMMLKSQLNQKTKSFNYEQMKVQLIEASRSVNERITFIDPFGRVVFDSISDSMETENHQNRPEFQRALSEGIVGTATRKSETTGQRLYYAAIVIENSNGKQEGILRISKPLDEMEGIMFRIRRSLIGFVSISLVLAVLITHAWSLRFSRPMEEIILVIEELSKQRYAARYRGRSYQEVDALGSTVNRLAENLSQQMNEIKQNARQLSELLDNLVIGVMVLNQEKQIEILNPAMEKLMGKTVPWEKGSLYIEQIKNYSLIHLIDSAYDKKTMMNKEIRLYYPTERIVDAHVIIYDNESTKQTNGIVLLYDMSHIRRLEKIRTDFVANASHELRTPVTALKGFSETLLDGAMDDRETLVEFLTIIQKESNRLDAIVRDILDLSKLEHQSLSFVEEKIDVEQVVYETFHLLDKKVESKKITLLFEQTSSVQFHGDRNRLKQIILNLVDNALSYTPKHGKVFVNVTEEQGELVLSVADTGIGIPEKDQARIFERFYRVDTARSRNSGGTGLGLSIVKYLVENFKGEITVQSTEETGTTFVVRLPNHLVH